MTSGFKLSYEGRFDEVLYFAEILYTFITQKFTVTLQKVQSDNSNPEISLQNPKLPFLLTFYPHACHTV